MRGACQLLEGTTGCVLVGECGGLLSHEKGEKKPSGITRGRGEKFLAIGR